MDGGRRSRPGVERAQRVPQPPVYILVHLHVSVRGEVVGVGQPLQPVVDIGVAGGVLGTFSGAGAAGSSSGSLTDSPGRSGSAGADSAGTPASGTVSLMPRRYPEPLGYRR